LLRHSHDDEASDTEVIEPALDDPEVAVDHIHADIISEEASPSWLGGDRPLKLPYHVAVSIGLWAITTTLAIVAPNLGDVLNLVGCATGTVIAFILPSLFSFKLKGYSHTAMLLLVVGGLVGMVGTFFRTKQLIKDAAN